jgi:hypothetical protein
LKKSGDEARARAQLRLCPPSDLPRGEDALRGVLTSDVSRYLRAAINALDEDNDPQEISRRVQAVLLESSALSLPVDSRRASNTTEFERYFRVVRVEGNPVTLLTTALLDSYSRLASLVNTQRAENGAADIRSMKSALVGFFSLMSGAGHE